MSACRVREQHHPRPVVRSPTDLGAPAAPSRPGLDAGDAGRRSGIGSGNRTAYDVTSPPSRGWFDLVRATDAIPARSGRRRILHSGPPIAWPDMCGRSAGPSPEPFSYEGWADDLDAAEKLAGSGAVALDPCHEHGAWGRWPHHQSVHAGLGGREHRGRQPRLLQPQRGSGQGAAVRRQLPDVLDGCAGWAATSFTTMQQAVRGLADPDLNR